MSPSFILLLSGVLRVKLLPLFSEACSCLDINSVPPPSSIIPDITLLGCNLGKGGGPMCTSIVILNAISHQSLLFLISQMTFFVFIVCHRVPVSVCDLRAISLGSGGRHSLNTCREASPGAGPGGLTRAAPDCSHSEGSSDSDSPYQPGHDLPVSLAMLFHSPLSASDLTIMKGML